MILGEGSDLLTELARHLNFPVTNTLMGLGAVRVLNEPTKTSYPNYDGSGTIDVMVSVLTDPDGFVIELNQLLTDDLGR